MSLLEERPVLDVSWRGGFTFRMIFGKVSILIEFVLIIFLISVLILKHDETNSWGIDEMDLVYNTKDSTFTESINGNCLPIFDQVNPFKCCYYFLHNQVVI